MARIIIHLFGMSCSYFHCNPALMEACFRRLLTELINVKKTFHISRCCCSKSLDEINIIDKCKKNPPIFLDVAI